MGGLRKARPDGPGNLFFFFFSPSRAFGGLPLAESAKSQPATTRARTAKSHLSTSLDTQQPPSKQHTDHSSLHAACSRATQHHTAPRTRLALRPPQASTARSGRAHTAHTAVPHGQLRCCWHSCPTAARHTMQRLDAGVRAVHCGLAPPAGVQLVRQPALHYGGHASSTAGSSAARPGTAAARS